MESDGRIVALLETAACYVTFEAECAIPDEASVETGCASTNGHGAKRSEVDSGKDDISDSSAENGGVPEVVPSSVETNGHDRHSADDGMSPSSLT